MARIRTIKPGFFTHEALFEAEKDSGLPLRLAYAGLWCQCDREGRFKWRPRELKLGILPYDDVDFSRVLDALLTRGWLVRYESGTDVFGTIPTFGDHQQINNRESSSTIPPPEPPSPNGNNNLRTREPRVKVASETREAHDTRGREGKGKDLKPTLSAGDVRDPAIPGVPASCEPPEATPPSTGPKLVASCDPESNPSIRDLATLVVLASPFYRAKPHVTAAGIMASERRAVYDAARWEIGNHAEGYPDAPRPSLGDALEALHQHVAQHERNSPKEFKSYRSKKLAYYFTDRPYHNEPEQRSDAAFSKTGSLVQGMKERRADPDYYRKTYGISE